MSTGSVTIKGYVLSVPLDARQSRVAIVQDDTEYRVLPRGAGADLAEEVNVQVEASGLVEQTDELTYITVRSYKVLEDSTWLDDEEAS